MVMAPAVTPEEHARLWREIHSAEAKTSGEIYVVVAHSADDFRLVPFLWAAAVALVLPWILWFATSLAFETILVLQVLCFLAVSAALSHRSIRYRLVPRGIAADAAHRAALGQLMAHGVHLDSNRTAILIYVCMLPRQIEIVADAGIHAKLDPKHWQELVQMIAGEAQSGRLVDGLAAAIRTAGDFLAKEFPATDARHRAGISRIVES